MKNKPLISFIRFKTELDKLLSFQDVSESTQMELYNDWYRLFKESWFYKIGNRAILKHLMKWAEFHFADVSFETHDFCLKSILKFKKSLNKTSAEKPNEIFKTGIDGNLVDLVIGDCVDLSHLPELQTKQKKSSGNSIYVVTEIGNDNRGFTLTRKETKK